MITRLIRESILFAYKIFRKYRLAAEQVGRDGCAWFSRFVVHENKTLSPTIASTTVERENEVVHARSRREKSIRASGEFAPYLFILSKSQQKFRHRLAGPATERTVDRGRAKCSWPTCQMRVCIYYYTPPSSRKSTSRRVARNPTIERASGQASGTQSSEPSSNNEIARNRNSCPFIKIFSLDKSHP